MSSPLARLIHETAMDLAPEIIDFRRDLHAHPELSNCEERTAARAAEAMRSLGLSPREKVGGHGVVALMEGDGEGPCVGARADMDALPVTEDSGLPFASTATASWRGREVGVMHACGHDVHVACLVGAARLLDRIRDRIRMPGTVKFLFQPAEEDVTPEGIAGALKFIRAGGVVDGPELAAVYALHVDPNSPAGHVGIWPGPSHANVDEFALTVRGMGSHGASPWAGVDPVVMASRIILAWQTLTSREVDTREPLVVSVCSIHGGSAFNILPETVVLEGTIRSYSPEVRGHVRESMPRIARGILASARMDFDEERDWRFTPHTIVGVNDEALAERGRPVLEDQLGAERLFTPRPSLGGEDFAYFRDEAGIPSLFLRLGSADPKGAPGTAAPLHSPHVNIDESCIAVGMESMVALILERLGATIAS